MRRLPVCPHCPVELALWLTDKIRRIAWSKYGPIAAISADSREIKGCALVHDQKTGRWDISTGVPIKLPEGYDGVLKHVCWSFTGVDLAVADTAGRILIYGAALGHSHIELRKAPVAGDDAGEMGCVVGMYWLPPYPQAQKVSPRSRSSGRNC